MNNSFSNSGNISGSNINVGSTLTNSIQTVNNGFPAAAPDDRQQLADLLAALKTELEKVPQEAPDQLKSAQETERRAKELVDEASAEEPDKEEVERRGNKLKTAAENIGKAMPAIASLVPQVLSVIHNIVK